MPIIGQYTDADATAVIAAQKGVANGIASLDVAGKVPSSQLTVNAMEYKGNWNATTNSPTLIDGTGNTGDLYHVSVAGTQNLGSGAISFNVGDNVVYSGTIWEKWSAGAVLSVNGATGVVVLTTSDITEGTNLYYTDTRARAAITGTTDRITSIAGVIDIAATYVGQTSITTLGTITSGTWTGSNIGVAYGGTGATAFTAGSLVFAGASGVYTQDNANLFFDDTKNYLGIGTATPLRTFDLAGSARTTGKATAVLTGSIDPTASTSVTGVGTLFLTELCVGDRITVNAETRMVTAIASNTSLTVSAAFSNTGNDTSPDVLYALTSSKLSDGTLAFIVNDRGDVGIGTAAPTLPFGASTGNVVHLKNISGTGNMNVNVEGAGAAAINYFIGSGVNDNGAFYWNEGTVASATTKWGMTYYSSTNASVPSALVIYKFIATAGFAQIITSGGLHGFGPQTSAAISARVHILHTTEQLRVAYDASNYYSTTVSSSGGVTFNAVGAGAGFTFSDAVAINGTLTLSAQNIVTDTTTGMKIGTAATQKLGFFNATPIVQQTTTSQTAATFVTNTSLIADDSATWDGYTIGDIVAILRAFGLLA